MLRRAAMLARLGTSCGANWWFTPCRARKAMLTPLWERMLMGEAGEPQGVTGLSSAIGS